MATRRSFLLGLGGALVAAGCSNGRRPGPATPGTRLVSGTLTSAHMHGDVAWTISTPSPVTGVVYCLHGRGNTHRFPFDTIDLPGLVASAGGGIAVAAVDGGLDSYWHARADGTDAQAMLLEEFMPMVEQRLALTEPKRALLGWSMGGYGSLLAAETFPDRFRAVVAASPALWTSPGDSAPGAFDSAEDYRAHDVFGPAGRLAGLTVRVDCGTEDPFIEATRHFVSVLPKPPQGSFGPGGHNAAYWRSIAPAQIATLQRAL